MSPVAAAKRGGTAVDAAVGDGDGGRGIGLARRRLLAVA